MEQLQFYKYTYNTYIYITSNNPANQRTVTTCRLFSNSVTVYIFTRMNFRY